MEKFERIIKKFVAKNSSEENINVIRSILLQGIVEMKAEALLKDIELSKKKKTTDKEVLKCKLRNKLIDKFLNGKFKPTEKHKFYDLIFPFCADVICDGELNISFDK